MKTDCSATSTVRKSVSPWLIRTAGERDGALIRAHRLGELRARRLLVRVRDERILDVLEGLQQRLMVRGHQPLLGRVLELDVGADAAAFEHRHGETRPDRQEPALPIEKVGGANALQARRAADEEAREELARGDADPRRLRGELASRRVRTSGRRRRSSDGNPTLTVAGGRGITSGRRQLALQRHRRLADQHAQAMHRLPGLLLEDRDRRRGGRDLRRRSLHIDVRREASVEEPLGEVDRLLLRAPTFAVASTVRCCRLR